MIPGVPHGSILGPIFYKKGNRCVNFADDTTLHVCVMRMWSKF